MSIKTRTLERKRVRGKKHAVSYWGRVGKEKGTHDRGPAHQQEKGWRRAIREGNKAYCCGPCKPPVSRPSTVQTCTGWGHHCSPKRTWPGWYPSAGRLYLPDRTILFFSSRRKFIFKAISWFDARPSPFKPSSLISSNKFWVHPRCKFAHRLTGRRAKCVHPLAPGRINLISALTTWL